MCDACDGPHRTDLCPIFKGKPRDNHKDATGGAPKGAIGSGSGGNFVLQQGRQVKMPPDGSCLFHSLCYGLGKGNAAALRKQIAGWIAANPKKEISGDQLKEWIEWDGGGSVASYTSKMGRSNGPWGGGIEMAACSVIYSVNIHVYERAQRGGYKRISCFDVPGASKTIHVLYTGSMHYDALVPG